MAWGPRVRTSRERGRRSVLPAKGISSRRFAHRTSPRLNAQQFVGVGGPFRIVRVGPSTEAKAS